MMPRQVHPLSKNGPPRRVRRARWGRCYAIGAAVIVLGGVAANPAAAVTFNTIALTGEAGAALGFGPGVEAGVHFNSFPFGALLNAEGDVAYYADLEGPGVTTSNNSGIWVSSGSVPSAIAREGAAGPGPNLEDESYYTALFGPSSFGDGVMFGGSLGGPQVTTLNSQAIFSYSESSTSLVRRGGVRGFNWHTYPVTTNPDYAASSTDQVVIHTVYQVAHLGPTYFSILAGAADSLEIVAGTGVEGPGPNVGEGVSFSSFYPNDILGPAPTVAVNSEGDVAFIGQLAGAGVNNANDRGIWTNVGGLLVNIAREGSGGPGPGFGEGVSFTDRIGRPALSDSGSIVFSAKVTGAGVSSTNDLGIWIHQSGVLTPVSRTGTEGTAAGYGPKLGPNVNFSLNTNTPLNAIINASGDVAFTHQIWGEGVNSTNYKGIWKSSQGELSLIARTGADGPGPNLGTGVHFSGFSDFAMNGDGDMVFRALLANSTQVDSTNNKGLWASIDGLIIPILRSGDLFDVDPGAGEDLRTIADVYFGGGYPGSTTFTDSGVIALSLSFTDGASGIFTAQLPSVAPIGGDYNGDGMIDAADYTVWRDTQGATGVGLAADANGDLVVDAFDYLTWRNNFGQPPGGPTSGAEGAAVPEPAAALLVLLAAVAWSAAPRGSRANHLRYFTFSFVDYKK